MQTVPEMEPVAGTLTRGGDGEAGLTVTVHASSTHPGDWGRAMARAVSLLIGQITDTTGSDPSRAPAGLDLSLHVTALPSGEAITVTWNG
ncbi:hypothetical protein [Pseudarthrobacter sp. S9]|uniref:hypothetical protein n=1 Tax=Pseudarthrobacter sp. S9 TaxID=3418421 RepID=UPI003D03AEA0